MNDYALSLDTSVESFLQANAVVAIGTSGGKDSDTAAMLVVRHLDQIGHRGERLLIHADLGEIEHADSLPQCQRLAQFLGIPLIVVRRRLGGMVDRWEQRWRDNLRRYANLECITLITPWSSAAMRFCTSELKIAPITSELAKRYKGQAIINVIGIRREESAARAQKPVSQINKKLTKNDGTQGIDWHPILELKVEDVFSVHHQAGFPAHEAYTRNGNKRVSCSVCVLSSLHDLQASLKDERNHQAFRRVVSLELKSSFSFQPNRWLSDVRIDLLSDEQRALLALAKERNQQRKKLESRIPKELRFVKGWPTFLPSFEQCQVLTSVRNEVGQLMGVNVRYTTPADVRSRYEELLETKKKKAAKDGGLDG